MCAVKSKAKSGLALKRESGVKLTAIYVVWSIKQRVTDTKKPRTYMKPEKQVTSEDAALKWYMVQSSCSVKVRGAEIKGAADKGTKPKKIIF